MALRFGFTLRSQVPKYHYRPSCSYRPFSQWKSQYAQHKVAVIGSGNWGSTIAKVVAENTQSHPHLFEPLVSLWVHEEMVISPYETKGDLSPSKKQPLSTVINQFHENVRYLPGVKLPSNIVAFPSLAEAVQDATILIFNLPHQFLSQVCNDLQGRIKPYARAISCIKGIEVRDGQVTLLPDLISRQLKIPCGALSGANIASEVAAEQFSETTIAYLPLTADTPPNASLSCQLAQKDQASLAANFTAAPPEYPGLTSDVVKNLFHRPYFHVRVISDVTGVSLAGALKNIIALAVGFVNGLGWGDNSKSAIIRVGITEMIRFGDLFFSHSGNYPIEPSTFTQESCGVADVITSCLGGRNFRCASEAVKRGVRIEDIESDLLNGQKLQGNLTARDVNAFLKSRQMEKEFPLFTAVYNILEGKAKPEDIPSLIEPNDKS